MRSATAKAPTCTGVHAPDRIASNAARTSSGPICRASARASRGGNSAIATALARRPAGRADAPHPVADQAFPFRRQHALGVELYALDVELTVPQAHDLALGRPRAHLEA